MRRISEENSAAAGGENLFTQPLKKYNLARSAMKRRFTQAQITGTSLISIRH
jgi:hypothetical protein